jgi:hypothetical protein
MDQVPESSTFRWKWLIAIAPLLFLGVFVYRWLNPQYEPPSQPNPNAYNDLVALGGKLARRTGFYDEMPEQELANVVATNEPVLNDARAALRKESMVPLDWEAGQSWFSGHVNNFSDLRSLARGFAAEGYQATRKGNTQLAVRCGMDNLRLASEISKGGLGTDWLVGVAIYGVGLGTLCDSCETASLADCRFVLKNLPEVSKHFDPPADITVREWHFWRRINGPYQTFLSELSFSNNRIMFEQQLEYVSKLFQTRTDLLRIHYALRAFKIEEQRLPKTLGELAGRELKAVPKDPFSGRDFIYVPGKDRYILYSVGPNQVDDGGMVNDQDPQQGDLVLEPAPPAESIERAD